MNYLKMMHSYLKLESKSITILKNNVAQCSFPIFRI
jgi:hypothetical protein